MEWILLDNLKERKLSMSHGSLTPWVPVFFYFVAIVSASPLFCKVEYCLEHELDDAMLAYFLFRYRSKM
jgi:hypothetical protein